MPFFSILIPAYNVEPYISKCLDSIIRQDFADWECIVIDDGSTDRTNQICSEYAETDNRIKVICQENSGVAVTRNRLIHNAIGKYFIFIDGDDWWNEKDMLRIVAQYLQNDGLDIAIWGAFYYDSRTSKKRIATEWTVKAANIVQTGEEYIRCALERPDKFAWWLFLYAFKRGLWLECNVSFIPGRMICEDEEILYKVILSAKRIMIINKVFYSYRICRETSAMTTPSLRSALDMLEVVEKCVTDIETLHIDDSLKKLLKANMSHAFMAMGYWLPKLKKEEQTVLYERLRQTKWMMKLERKTIRNLIEQIPVRVLGIRAGFRLLQTEEKIRQIMKQIIWK